MIFLSRRVLDHNLALMEIEHFDDRFDKLWQDASADYDIIIKRDSKYLKWRFEESPNEYNIFASMEGERVTGYIVLRIINYYGVRTGRIIDIFAHLQDKKTIEALLDRSLEFFKANNCELAECLILTDINAYHKALRTRGFLFKKTTVEFGVITDDTEQLSLLKDPRNWFVTNADPDLEI